MFWNGLVHWINPLGPGLRFDVDAEKLWEMPMPPLPRDEMFNRESMSFGYFAESGNRLHFIDSGQKPGYSHLNVFELERDYSGWFVKYVVDLSPVSAAFPEMIGLFESESESDDDRVDVADEYFMSVLCIVRGEIEKDSFLVMNVPGKVLRYDFESGDFYELCDVPIPNRLVMIFESYEAYQYIESLACV